MTPIQRTRLSTPTISYSKAAIVVAAASGLISLNAADAGGQPGAADRLRAVPGSVTFAEVFRHADSHAPSIQITRTAIQLARSSVAAAGPSVPSNPVLRSMIGPRMAGGSSGLDFSIGVSQSLAVGGQIAARRRAAVDSVAAAKATVATERWRVHVRVHRLLLQAIVNRAVVDQATKMLRFSESLRGVAATKAAAGQSAPLSLLLADAEVASARESLVEASAREQRTRIELATVAGWPQAEVPQISDAPPKIVSAPALATLQRQMQRSHPLIVARKAAVAAARSTRVAARRAATPNISVQAGYDREGNPGPGGGAPNHIWTIGVSVPFAVAQKNQGPRAAASAAVTRAEAELAAVAIALRGQLATAVSRMNAAVRQVAIYDETIMPKLRRNLALLLRAYRIGEADMTAVSQTRQRLLQATRRFNDARTRYYAARASVEAAVGAELDAQGSTP